MLRVSGVWVGSTVPSRPEMRPSSVRSPVATTTASAVPAVTRVPPCNSDRRSASSAAASTGSAALSTGTDSPVRAASSARSPRACRIRRSATTRAPASSDTTSPGTRASASACVHRPSRRTLAGSDTSWASAWIALPARYSWANPMSALSTTTASTTVPSGTSPSANATAAEARSA